MTREHQPGTWKVVYGDPFPGHRTFTDLARALEFAETAHAENPTITTDPATLRQLLDAVWNEGYRVGYESPDMPIDYTPLSPYSPDRLEQDA